MHQPTTSTTKGILKIRWKLETGHWRQNQNVNMQRWSSIQHLLWDIYVQWLSSTRIHNLIFGASQFLDMKKKLKKIEKKVAAENAPSVHFSKMRNFSPTPRHANVSHPIIKRQYPFIRSDLSLFLSSPSINSHTPSISWSHPAAPVDHHLRSCLADSAPASLLPLLYHSIGNLFFVISLLSNTNHALPFPSLPNSNSSNSSILYRESPPRASCLREGGGRT